MSPSRSSNPYNQPGSYNPPSRRKACLRCGCMLFIALLALVVIGLVGLRTFLIQKLGQDRIDQLSIYDTEVVKAPEAWQKTPTLPSDEVVDFQLKLYNELTAIGDQFNDKLYSGLTTETLFYKMHTSDALTSGEQQTVDQLTAALKPIIDETSAALSLPDYTADMMLYTSGSEFLQIQNFAKYSAIAALETARRGDCKTAMDIAALPIRYMKFEKPASLIYELIRVAVIRISSDAIESISDQCTDVAAVRHGLNLMTQLRDEVKPLSEEEWLVTDPISLINRVKAFGYPVKPGPQTRTHMMWQLTEIFGKPYNAWAVQHFPKDDPRHVAAQEKLDSMRDSGIDQADQVKQVLDKLAEQARKLTASGLSRKFFGFNPASLLTEVAMPNFDEAAARGDIMFAVYDLTRLHLAQRILELQKEQGATATDTITELIPSMPSDPFSSGTLRFRNETNQFYSLGPDKDDDNQSVLYDATNGTFSDGDIYLKQ